MSEPENALYRDKENPSPSVDLAERVADLEARLDHVEQELALLCGKGLLSRIGRKLALE